MDCTFYFIFLKKQLTAKEEQIGLGEAAVSIALVAFHVDVSQVGEIPSLVIPKGLEDTVKHVIPLSTVLEGVCADL